MEEGESKSITGRSRSGIILNQELFWDDDKNFS